MPVCFAVPRGKHVRQQLGEQQLTGVLVPAKHRRSTHGVTCRSMLQTCVLAACMTAAWSTTADRDAHPCQHRHSIEGGQSSAIGHKHLGAHVGQQLGAQQLAGAPVPAVRDHIT
jgi:hypothetical protein